jgi:hypothetical protein
MYKKELPGKKSDMFTLWEKVKGEMMERNYAEYKIKVDGNEHHIRI